MRSIIVLKRVAFFAVLFSLLSFKNTSPHIPQELEIHLKPVYNQMGIVQGMEVRYMVPFQDDLTQHDLLLQLDLLEPFLKRENDTVTNLVVRDEKGTLVLEASKKLVSADGTFQILHGKRKSVGKVLVNYYMPAANPNPKTRGPHVDMQVAGNGLSGSFNGILLLPDLKDKLSLHIIWDLPAGVSAVTTFGNGNSVSTTTFDYLMDAQFMVGPLQIFPDPPPSAGFSVYGLGRNIDEVAQGSVWPRQAYNTLLTALNGSPNQAFRFFIRSYDGGPLNRGRASEGSFLLYLPIADSLNKPMVHSLIAHEMIHVFVPGLTSSSDEGDWYVEGIADYLSFIIPYKANLYSKSYFLDLINTESAEYYTNALRRTPNKEIPSVMWSGRNAWTVPYARGMLYFANLDAKLDQMKNPHPTVLSLIQDMNERAAKGDTLTAQTWVNLLREKAGAWAVDEWNRMNNGELVLPAATAFGDSFTARKIKTGYFDLGFKLPKNLQKGRKISEIIPGSPADKAGIKENDEITESVNLLPIYGSYNLPVTIKVNRNGQQLSFTYSPRVGSYDAIEWSFTKKEDIK